MTRAAAAVTIAGTDTTAPTLSATQRATFRFGFLRSAVTGRYELVDERVPGEKKYLHRDATSGRLYLADAQEGSIRMIRLANGRISVS